MRGVESRHRVAPLCCGMESRHGVTVQVFFEGCVWSRARVGSDWAPLLPPFAFGPVVPSPIFVEVN